MKLLTCETFPKSPQWNIIYNTQIKCGGGRERERERERKRETYVKVLVLEAPKEVGYADAV
jgi:hypothetical protein